MSSTEKITEPAKQVLEITENAPPHASCANRNGVVHGVSSDNVLLRESAEKSTIATEGPDWASQMEDIAQRAKLRERCRDDKALAAEGIRQVFALMQKLPPEKLTEDRVVQLLEQMVQQTNSIFAARAEFHLDDAQRFRELSQIWAQQALMAEDLETKRRFSERSKSLAGAAATLEKAAHRLMQSISDLQSLMATFPKNTGPALTDFR